MSLVNNEAQPRTETLSDYAYQQIRRVFSNCRNEVEKQLKETLPEAGEKLDLIIDMGSRYRIKETYS